MSPRLVDFEEERDRLDDRTVLMIDEAGTLGARNPASC